MTPTILTPPLTILPKKQTSLRVQFDHISPPHFCKKCFGTSEWFRMQKNLVNKHVFFWRRPFNSSSCIMACSFPNVSSLYFFLIFFLFFFLPVWTRLVSGWPHDHTWPANKPYLKTSQKTLKYFPKAFQKLSKKPNSVFEIEFTYSCLEPPDLSSSEIEFFRVAQPGAKEF